MTEGKLLAKSTIVIQFFVAMLLFGTYQSFVSTINTGQNIMLAEIIEIIEEVDGHEDSQSGDEDVIVYTKVNNKKSFLIKEHSSRTKFKYLYSLFDVVIPPPERYC